MRPSSKSRVVSFFRVGHIKRRLHKSELDKSLVLPLSRDNNMWGLHEVRRLHKSELDQSLVLPLSRVNNIGVYKENRMVANVIPSCNPP